jgi:DNA-binding NtrC family response regulator/tetratricopeptide (TPR) repeat protein
MSAFPDLLGTSAGIVAVRQQLERLLTRPGDARRLPSVLIEGETGTGKGLLARSLHRASARRDGPFVDVNCAAIPEALLEAEMFGFERGAFTDAREAKPGLVQTAHRGTLFLDEISLLPEALQSKLLKVVEDRVVRRLGATKGEAVDVWIIAATNADLALAIRGRRFRQDLYHRLAVVTVVLPPLRDRGEDVLVLASHFLARACQDYGVPAKRLDAGARAALLDYAWPGNVRELGNVMERVVLQQDAPLVSAAMLGLPVAVPAVPAPRHADTTSDSAEETKHDPEREHLLDALRECGWNVSQVAARLGVSRNTVRYRLEKHGLRPDRRGRHGSGPAQPIPGPEAAPSVPDSVVRWERRRIALLTVVLAGHFEEVGPSAGLRLDKVQVFGGRIEDLAPTGLVAAFGLTPTEDAPRRAANAALAMLKAVERDHANVGGAPLSAKAAVHVAEVTVGRLEGGALIDQPSRRTVWTALDDLLASAEAGTIAVSEAAAPLLARHYDLAPVGGSWPRVYRLASGERLGLGAGALSPFVGRRQDHELLLGRLEAVADGRGQVVGVTGEAGIGKSRLLFELSRAASRRGLGYLVGHCVSYGAAVPYLPVLDLLRAGCHIVEADPPPIVTAKVRAAFRDVGVDSDDPPSWVLRLLGLPPPLEPLAMAAPEVVKARTVEALRELVLRWSRRGPLVLAVEDLHWADPSTEEFLAALAESVPMAPILLVVTYRPGYGPPWTTRSYATQIGLQPLPREEARAIVEAVLPEASARVADLILDKAEGNPFFLEELARAARERQGEVEDLQVPNTVEDVLRARLDRLPADDERLLQIGAVIGKDFPVPLLQRVADVADEPLRAGLLRLAAAEFLHGSGIDSERQYTFRHPLTHEVVFRSVLPEQRRLLHARIVDKLEEELPAARRLEHAERLAYHALQGEVWDKAVDYLRQAGARAFLQGSFEEHFAYCEQALAASARLPRTPDNVRRAIDARLDLHTPLIVRGQVPRLIELHREAQDFAQAIADAPRLGRAFYRMGQYAWMLGRYEDGLAHAGRALDIAKEIDDVELRMIGTYVSGVNRYSMGAYGPAIRLFEEVLDGPMAELARRRSLGLMAPPYIVGCGWMCVCLAFVGDFARAWDVAVRGVEAANAIDHPLAQASAYTMCGLAAAYMGRFAEGLLWGERAVDLCRARGLMLQFPGASSVYGWALAWTGRAEEGVPHLERGVSLFEQLGVRTHLSQQYVRWGDGLWLAGRLGEARDAAERALELARAAGERGFEVEALGLRGRVRAAEASPDVAAAERDFEDAGVLAEATGMRLLVARARLDLGHLYRRAGREAAAGACLIDAVTRFQAMDAPDWVATARRALDG